MNSDQITNNNQPTNDEQIIKEYAGFWVRFVAMIIDFTLLSILYGILLSGILYFFPPFDFDQFFNQAGHNQISSQDDLDQFFNQNGHDQISSPDDFNQFFNQDGSFDSEYQLLYSLFGYLQIILPLILTVWFWRRYRATPGKMALKLEVVDADSGKTASFGQCIGRFIAYIISAIPFHLGFIWAAFDKRKQGWHDKLANTVVIKKRKVPVKFVADA